MSNLIDGFILGDLQVNYTARGLVSSYQTSLYHAGLNETRIIKSSSQEMLLSKIEQTQQRLLAKWDNLQEKLRKNKSLWGAQKATEKAQKNLQDCNEILLHTLSIDDVINWDHLKNNKNFIWKTEKNNLINYDKNTNEPLSYIKLDTPLDLIEEPTVYLPDIKFIDRVIPSLRRKKEAAAAKINQAAADLNKKEKDKHKEKVEKINLQNKERLSIFQQEKEKFSKEKTIYLKKQQELNKKVDEFKENWILGQMDAIQEHAELVLNESKYPDWNKKQFACFYQSSTKTLCIDYDLPTPSDLPTLEKVTYIQSRNELTEKHISATKAKKLFDDVCYQMTLRSIHEIYEADTLEHIENIVFNGWVEDINPTNGLMQRNCILTINALRNEFEAIFLENVDPKLCFKSLKGIAAPSLKELIAVKPVLQLNTDDPRFIESYNVVETLNDSVNLAAMPWEDFEHLIRELFQKIYAEDGADVKVTQSSRDGGVDAVIFDPDPIKGGKTIIQAKRYTLTVGVSAVRDLYGTVMNEGANRGILVTTSDFGPDAHKFAAGKPITLIGGSNLLSLLEDQGHSARIDLKEAREQRI